MKEIVPEYKSKNSMYEMLDSEDEHHQRISGNDELLIDSI